MNEESKHQNQIISEYKNSKDGDVMMVWCYFLVIEIENRYVKWIQYSAAFLWEKVAEFYKATPLLFFTFMFIKKIVVLIEFRENDNKKSPDPTRKAQLRNWNADIQ